MGFGDILELSVDTGTVRSRPGTEQASIGLYLCQTTPHVHGLLHPCCMHWWHLYQPASSQRHMYRSLECEQGIVMVTNHSNAW